MSIGILADVLYNVFMPKNKQVTAKKVGRPTDYSNEKVLKLEEAFKFGATVDQAVAHAGIVKSTYYEWIDKHPDFQTKMEDARQFLANMAKNLIKSSVLAGDVNTAKWYLEKTEYKQVVQNNTQVNISNPPVLVEFIDAKENEGKPKENTDSGRVQETI